MVDQPGPNVLTLDIPPKLDEKTGNYIPGTGGVFHFRQDVEGLLPKTVRDLLVLRKHYKGLMKAATDPDEKLGYDMLQMAVKVAVNAIYGHMGMGKLQVDGFLILSHKPSLTSVVNQLTCWWSVAKKWATVP